MLSWGLFARNLVMADAADESSLRLPEGLSRPVYNRAVDAILRWEDQGEIAGDLAVELFLIFSKFDELHGG